MAYCAGELHASSAGRGLIAGASAPTQGHAISGSRVRAEAYSILRKAYFDDVGSCAEKLLEGITEGRTKGKLSTILPRTIKNHPRVTETVLAQETMLYSFEDGSALKEVGIEGAIEKGRITGFASSPLRLNAMCRMSCSGSARGCGRSARRQHSCALRCRAKMSNDDHWLAPKEVAEIMGVDVRTVYALVRAGEIRHARISDSRKGQIRFRRIWIDRWIEDRARGGER